MTTESKNTQAVLDALHRIEARLATVESSCSHMDRHIGFIESVYNAIRAPFSRVLRMVQATPTLPEIDSTAFNDKD